MRSRATRAALAIVLAGVQPLLLLGQALGTASSTASAVKPESSAQAQQLALGTGQEGGTPQIPVLKLDFKTQPPVPGAPALPVIVSPILCSPDGVPFLDAPQPPDFMDHAVYSLDPHGATAFSPKSISGLYDVRFRGYFASDSTVGLLVTATQDDKKATGTYTLLPGTPPRSIYTGEHHEYLALFDRGGSYKEKLDLPAAYNFLRLAPLSDGKLVALATDRINSVPHLLLLEADGQVARQIEPPAAMLASPDLQSGESSFDRDRARTLTSLSWWRFVSARQRVLLYQAHSRSPVLEVGSGGAVREVTISAPTDYLLDSVISSNDRWIIRYKKEDDMGASGAGPTSQALPYTVYDVDANDGSLRSRLDVGSGQLFGIACEQDGVFTAFTLGGEKTIRQTADIPR
jgi:hypothetical protein